MLCYEVWNGYININLFHLRTKVFVVDFIQKAKKFWISLLLGSLCCYISQICNPIATMPWKSSNVAFFLRQSRPRWRPAGYWAATGVGIEAFSGSSQKLLRRYQAPVSSSGSGLESCCQRLITNVPSQKLRRRLYNQQRRRQAKQYEADVDFFQNKDFFQFIFLPGCLY